MLEPFGFRIRDVSDPQDPSDTHWGLRIEYVPPDQLASDTATAPTRDPRFLDRCQTAFRAIIAAGPAGITRGALRGLGIGGDAMVGRIIAHLADTGHIVARDVASGPMRARGTYYSAAPGRTSFDAAASPSVGMSVGMSVDHEDELSELFPI
jgi:hypothetical protein